MDLILYESDWIVFPGLSQNSFNEDFYDSEREKGKKNQRCDVDQSVSICTLSLLWWNMSTWFAYIYIFPYTTCFILYAYCLRIFLLNLNMYYFSIFIPKYDIRHAIRFLVCSNNKLHCTMVCVNSFNMRNILWDVSLYVKFSFYFCAHVMMTTQWNHSALMSSWDISVNLEMDNQERMRS